MVRSGLALGFVLGSLRFILYIKLIALEIDTAVHAKLLPYDRLAYSVVDSREHQGLLCRNLWELGDWCERQLMQIIFTDYFIGREKEKKALDYDYPILNNRIERCTETKYLAIHITRTLEWNKRIDCTSAEAFKKLCFFRRKLGRFPTTIKPIQQNSASPAFETCMSCLGPLFRKRNIKQL